MNGIAGSTAIRNGSSLMYKSYRDDIAQDYGMPYLFVRYVIDRMAGSYEPMAVLPRFYTVDASSLTCEAYLEKVTGIPFKTLLSDHPENQSDKDCCLYHFRQLVSQMKSGFLLHDKQFRFPHQMGL